MSEELLQPWRRFIWVLTGLIGIISFCGFFITFIESELALPFIYRLCFLVLSIYGLGLSILSFYIVKKRRVHIRKDTNILIGVFLFHVVLMMVIFLMLNSYMRNPIKGSPVILQVGIFIFVVSMVIFLRYFEKTRAEKQEDLTDEEQELANLEKMINGDKKKK